MEKVPLRGEPPTMEAAKSMRPLALSAVLVPTKVKSSEGMIWPVWLPAWLTILSLERSKLRCRSTEVTGCSPLSTTSSTLKTSPSRTWERRGSMRRMTVSVKGEMAMAYSMMVVISPPS